jgi:hypothetical protein
LHATPPPQIAHAVSAANLLHSFTATVAPATCLPPLALHPQQTGTPVQDLTRHCTAQKKKKYRVENTPAKIYAVIYGKYTQIHQLGVFPPFSLTNTPNWRISRGLALAVPAET